MIFLLTITISTSTRALGNSSMYFLSLFGVALPNIHLPPKASNQNKWRHASITNRQQIHSLIRLLMVYIIDLMCRYATRIWSQSDKGHGFSHYYYWNAYGEEILVCTFWVFTVSLSFSLLFFPLPLLISRYFSLLVAKAV